MVLYVVGYTLTILTTSSQQMPGPKQTRFEGDENSVVPAVLASVTNRPIPEALSLLSKVALFSPRTLLSSHF